MDAAFAPRRPTCFMFLMCSTNELPLWQQMVPSAPVMLYDVHPASDEGGMLSSMFHKTLIYPHYSIQRIFRVQNPILWLHYTLKRKQIEQDLEGLDADERRLFHGTYRDKLEAIVRQGFDWRIGKTHGKMFGNGTYFASTASCAHQFTDSGGNHLSARWMPTDGFLGPRQPPFPHPPLFNPNYPQFTASNREEDIMINGRPRYKTHTPLPFERGTSDIWSLFNNEAQPHSHFIIVTRVLVGRYTIGTMGLQRPPAFDNRDSLLRLYDTCVDNIYNPEKFVIFDQNQAYPEYIIEYRVV